jgi:hypothetical protein
LPDRQVLYPCSWYTGVLGRSAPSTTITVNSISTISKECQP